MRALDLADMGVIRGGLYMDPVDNGGGGADVGGGFELTAYTMNALTSEAANGTDESVMNLAQSMYTAAGPFDAGGQYYVPPPGSPPPSMEDIAHSVPGTPKEKVHKISAGFHIC